MATFVNDASICLKHLLNANCKSKYEDESRAKQEICKKFSHPKQIQSLKSQFITCIKDNNEQHQQQYHSGHTQLLYAKQNQLDEILIDDNESRLLDREINLREISSHKREIVNKKYSQIDTQRDELSTNNKLNDETKKYNFVIKQFNSSQIECKETSNIPTNVNCKN